MGGGGELPVNIKERTRKLKQDKYRSPIIHEWLL